MSMVTALDKKQLRRSFARAAHSYDANAVLQREIAGRMFERLQWIRMDPAQVLDIGSGTGYCTRALSKRYRRARVVGVDIAPAMAQVAQSKRAWRGRERYLCADAEALPLADASVDLVFSNLMLQWCVELEVVFSNLSFQWCQPEPVFRECYRVLRPGGLLLVSSFGPDTLRELRQAWQCVDSQAHVHEFIDMHDLGDALLQTRFADPVMDMEQLVLTYEDVMSLLRDLKGIGANNAARTRATGLMGKQHFARFCQAYATQSQQGRIPATYEVVYGHAWVPDPKPPLRSAPGVRRLIPVFPVGAQ